jgi:hypothetical protein
VRDSRCVKRYISKTLKLIAGVYLSFPVAYILMAAVLFDIPAKACMRVLLNPFYYLISAFAVAAGYGIWEMRRWAWYILAAANVLIVYGNAILATEFGENHHKLLAFVASLAIIAGVMYRVAREIRVPYFFPKIRWWESNPRYRLSVPVKLSRKGGGQLDAEILDLSMGGCFVKMRHELSQDETVGLSFTAFGYFMKCDGVVVWRTESTVTHPRGAGIKFAALDRQQKRKLKLINYKLRKIAALYRKSRYLLNQDEFLKRLQEIEGHKNSEGRLT